MWKHSGCHRSPPGHSLWRRASGNAKPAPTAPPPRPPDEPLPRAERRVGAAAGGGYFGLRGVYVVTSDGYIHEQIMATGLDYAPPVKFLPPSNRAAPLP